MSLGLLAHSVQADELLGDLVDGFLRAALVLAQSAPPILVREGSSDPVYFEIWSSASVGTKSRSAGWPRLEGAYSMTR